MTLLAPTAFAAPKQPRTCTNDREAMPRLAGRYANAELVRQVAAQRRWRWDGISGPGEVRVAPDGVTDLFFDWHEAASLVDPPEGLGSGCFVDRGRSLHMSVRAWAKYDADLVRIPVHYAHSNDGFFFDVLFKGRFVDQAGRSWTFATNELTVDGEAHAAELMLDQSELPEGGAVLRIKGEKLLWVFEPAANGGWLVLKSDWASAEGYDAPDFKKPWKTLVPR